jgi:hypothetical protein
VRSYAQTKKPQNFQQHFFPANPGRRLSRAISLSTTFSVVVCVWGVRGQPEPHGAREKITVIFLHTQIAGKFFVMNQSLSFSLSPPLSPSLSYVFFIISPATYIYSFCLAQSFFFLAYTFFDIL